ncbi:hypothetical protein HII31_02908 [Pseudocercospora fuligena]|uniref:DUF1989 domain-containing protein n=1 Tax=Pseudocercospora fuligena TaxID=685502 RepID=A0A8H6RRV1_9PEZI|nr:hypothetical protein HII31_02908 [Pseudocercospora fuligena]
MAEPQTIPARHGVATFVPAGQSIKIINTSGGQVVDTWAFALPQPAPRKDVEEKTKEEASKEETAKAAEKVKSKSADLPSQEEAEQATREAQVQAEQAEQDGKKSGWSSYVPSLSTVGLGGKKAEDTSETKQKKNSRTWSEYFKPGKGVSSYVPEVASNTVSKFVNIHNRDTNKSYLEQLQDFSKTPVGAAGMSALTGSGYSGSLYAGYQAWNARNAADAPNMEFMSMPHSRASSLHMVPKVGDTWVTNLREPILTLEEDTSPGVHDTLIAACDPQRYHELGVEKWEEHGSCAENLVLALKELNERAGLKGAKAVGAEVTINSVPAPLNLFMNIPWNPPGNLSFKAPRSKAGDYVRFKAERDVVVVMSACPQDVLDINNRQPTDAHFVVEEESTAAAIKRTTAPKKKPMPRKASTANATAGAASTSTPTPVKKNPVPSKPPPKTTAQASQAPKAVPAQPAKKTPQPAKAPAQSVKTPAQPAARPVKKPVPPAVKPQQTNGTPVEKKKPRKLVRQPSEA